MRAEKSVVMQVAAVVVKKYETDSLALTADMLTADLQSAVAGKHLI